MPRRKMTTTTMMMIVTRDKLRKNLDLSKLTSLRVFLCHPQSATSNSFTDGIFNGA